jgi:Asp-tRNA(Asn)/Glu-tRNA(Gln) amidotransferase A subunit family amidase
MSQSELCFMEATDLTRRIREGDVSCLEVMQAHLARIIHQPEKSTGEGDYVARMNHKITLLQAHEAPKTISSGCPDTSTSV